MSAPAVQPFTIAVPDAVLGDLRARLERVRWPDEAPGAPCAAFPREIIRPPRSLAERVYADLRRWTRMPSGGHFAALEEPEALAADIRAFFRELRA